MNPTGENNRKQDKFQKSLSIDELCHGLPTNESGFWLRELDWFGFQPFPVNRLMATFDRLAGGFEGRDILELGPFEGSHSVSLSNFSPASVISIEANPYNFLKCLIVKQYYGLANTNFMLGNFVKYLESCDRRFDFILASGVLYHLSEPLQVLDLIMKHTDSIGVSTSVYVEGDCQFDLTGKTREVSKNGQQFKLFERVNLGEAKGKKHGIGRSAWMFMKEDLLRFLNASGWNYEVIPGERLATGSPKCQLYANRKT